MNSCNIVIALATTMICNLSTLNTLSEKVIFQVKSSGFCSVPRCHPFDYDLHVIRVSSFSFAYGPNPAAPLA